MARSSVPTYDYVIVGHYSSNDVELIGTFATEQAAQEWADTHAMFEPYTITWMNSPDDEIYA